MRTIYLTYQKEQYKINGYGRRKRDGKRKREFR